MSFQVIADDRNTLSGHLTVARASMHSRILRRSKSEVNAAPKTTWQQSDNAVTKKIILRSVFIPCKAFMTWQVQEVEVSTLLLQNFELSWLSLFWWYGQCGQSGIYGKKNTSIRSQCIYRVHENLCKAIVYQGPWQSVTQNTVHDLNRL